MAATTVKNKIIDSLTMFYSNLKGSYDTSLASTSEDVGLAASAGKSLQDQINTLNSRTTLPHQSLGEDIDLDTITESGIYSYFQNQTHSPYAQNNLFSGNGNMLVVNGGSVVHQIIFLFNTNIYMRRYTGTWNVWTQFTSNIIDAIYPVGSLYMSINSTMPAALTTGRTWAKLSGGYVLKVIDSGTAGTTTAAAATGQASGNTGAASGNTGSTTLTAAQSGCPAHGHGNTLTFTTPKFTHSITQPVFSVTSSGTCTTGNESANHTHSFGMYKAGSAGNGTGTAYKTFMDIAGTQNITTAGVSANHTHTVPNHTHTLSRTTNVAVGNHAASACTKGGSVSNNTAANASSGHTHTLNSHTHTLNSHTHTTGMPANIGIYVWQRIA